jgi:hypothetical protein
MNMPLKGALAFTVVSLPCLLICLQAGCTTRPPTASEPQRLQGSSELQRLQGYWEGDGAAGKCSITITGNSLHFFSRTDFWFETTFALPAGTDPLQLHATIKNSAPPTNGIGEVVFAIYKIEDGTLTLAVEGGEPPKTFAGASAHYNLKKVRPGNAEASTSKEPETPNNAPANPDPLRIFDPIITLPF